MASQKVQCHILALGSTAFFVIAASYASFLRICAPCQFYAIGATFFFVIRI
jgi:hypothetical protein